MGGEFEKQIKEINRVLRKPMIATTSGLVAMRMEELIDLQNLVLHLEKDVDKAKKEFPADFWHDNDARKVLDWFVRWFGSR